MSPSKYVTCLPFLYSPSNTHPGRLPRSESLGLLDLSQCILKNLTTGDPYPPLALVDEAAEAVCEADLGLLPGKAPGQVLPVALGHVSSTLTFSSLQTAIYGTRSLSLFSPFFFAEHLQALSVSLRPSTLLQIVHSPGADRWWWPPSPQARRPGHPYSPERPLPSQPGSCPLAGQRLDSTSRPTAVHHSPPLIFFLLAPQSTQRGEEGLVPQRPEDTTVGKPSLCCLTPNKSESQSWI